MKPFENVEMYYRRSKFIVCEYNSKVFYAYQSTVFLRHVWSDLHGDHNKRLKKEGTNNSDNSTTLRLVSTTIVTRKDFAAIKPSKNTISVTVAQSCAFVILILLFPFAESTEHE